MSENTNKTRCIACRSEIYIGATICPECSSEQYKWKNLLRFYGAYAGLAAVVATYVFTTLSPIYWNLFGKDRVEVLGFNSAGHLVLQNVGDGDIYLIQLTITQGLAPFKFTSTRSLLEIARAGQFVKIPFKDDMAMMAGWSIMTYLSEELFREKADYFEKLIDEDCVKFVAYSATDPDYLAIQAHKKFKTFPVKVTLVFQSVLARARREHDIHAVALPHLNTKNPVCEKKALKAFFN